jgi:uncharacterized membrane protein (UPF0127 family)
MSVEPTRRSRTTDSRSDAWLVSNGRVGARARLAVDRESRRRGLLGTEDSTVDDSGDSSNTGDIEGALVLPSCRWVHTIGMRRAIEVAYLDDHGRVIKSVHMRPHRVGAPVPRARTVVEASEGAFARWGLRVGDTIEVRTT